MDVELLAHRGLWKQPDQRNSIAALRRGLEMGFGLETDLRDQHGQVVISHDPPAGEGADCLSLRGLCELYRDAGSTATLALNIKSDGLAAQVNSTLEQFQIRNYFVFDMSIPDMLGYLRLGLNCFSRQSEFESQPALPQRCQGIWLDAFESLWFDDKLIDNHLDEGRNVCLVSPELHRRSAEELWPLVCRIAQRPSEKAKLMLCTDFPEEFQRYQQCHTSKPSSSTWMEFSSTQRNGISMR
ncbi:MAG: hypothetical protein MI861_10430 [Pirellulales bacterium]|nr:hypothetical protein [Pirellulales bacterium]